MKRSVLLPGILLSMLTAPGLWAASKAGGENVSSAKSKKRPAAESPAPSPRKKSEPEPSGADASGKPRVHAVSAIVVDAQTGRVLHAVNPDQERAVASTQKLMTALLVAENGGLDRVVTVQRSDTWAEPSKLEIQAGESYRRGDLLRVLMVKSMNDVARALARDHSGSVEAFAKRMNARAQELGMENSYFINPNGLPAPGQHSTARDMAKLAVAAYKNRAIRDAVRLKELRWEHPDGKISLFHNTNRVLSSLEACNGMKTGYTVAAGFCLVSSASAAGRDVIAVVLGDTKEFVWKDSHNLLSWALGSDAIAAQSR
ncbi:MAG: hypothetical protein RLZZ399_598 [Verrucomicrobiota bacterium]|jgi:D-alanyl-D-alanine carboxypeptidase (penicillin-binding protein 5/6)